MLELTIAIPTYNRHEKLLNTLNSLNMSKGMIPINIIIIDNCSTPPVSDYLLENNYLGFSYTKVYRNNGNIGLAANLLMCFVHTNTNWMWLLGDDDLPLPDCLINIMHEIDKADDEDFLIKFNSGAGRFPEYDATIFNENEFIELCKDIKYYSNMLFISNSVFRVTQMQNYLRIMFEYTNTMAPHIIGILENLKELKRIKVINKYITTHGIAQEEDSWDWHSLREGVLHFSDLQCHKDFTTKMISRLYMSYLSSNAFYLQAIVYPFRFEGYSADYWRWYYWKSAFLFTGLKSLYLSLISKTIKFYFNSKIINNLLLKIIKPKRHINIQRK